MNIDNQLSMQEVEIALKKQQKEMEKIKKN